MAAAGQNAAMNEHDQLLEEARGFCDPVTGEVIERIPEDLMEQLRAAKLAVGIWGMKSRTAATAKWFVFLSDEIRDQALAEWREAKRRRRRGGRHGFAGSAQPPMVDACVTSRKPAVRGLGRFLARRKSDS
jgi:hypothetical protein